MQTLIRDPRNNRGIAVVRLEDPKGGREGYTFDIEWRGLSGGRSGSGSGFGGNRSGNRFSAHQAMSVCQDAVRQRAAREYNYRSGEFARIAADNRPGRHDWIVGSYVGHRGRNREEFTFACSVDFNSGVVRSLDFRRR